METYKIHTHEQLQKKRKMKIMILVLLLTASIVGSLVTYFVLFAYNNSTDNFQLSFGIASNPTQIDRGTQIQVYVYVDYNSKDHITLTTSGTGSSFAIFYNKNIENGNQLFSNITITGNANGADLIIYIPDNTQSGSYTVQITGTNSAGITSNITYSFSVV